MVREYTELRRAGKATGAELRSAIDVKLLGVPEAAAGEVDRHRALTSSKERETRLAGGRLSRAELLILFPVRSERLAIGIDQPKQLTAEEVAAEAARQKEALRKWQDNHAEFSGEGIA